MNAMETLIATQRAWERTQPQLFFELDQDPAVPVGTSCRSDGAYPERNGRIPPLADGTDGATSMASRSRGELTASLEERPSASTYVNGRSGSPTRASAAAATGGER